MDRAALRLLNALLGNDDHEAAIELHFPAGEIEFISASTFCVTGADFFAHLDGVSIDNWRIYGASEGSVLSFAGRACGQRAYLGISGGFYVESWLGSSSTNTTVGMGGLAGRPLAIGDVIEFKDPERKSRNHLCLGTSLVPRCRNSATVRITAGPEFEWLTPLSVETLFTEGFQVTPESNRMGYRLTGRCLELIDELEMVSTAVGFGTIQLLPNGQIVILMADHQTAGGYPRIGNVVNRDLSLIAQIAAGDRVYFAPVSVEAAEAIDLEFEKQLAFLRVGRQFGIRG